MAILKEKPLYFGDLKVPFPIVQGGMGVGISMHRLAGAVAAAGGVGVLSAAAPGFTRPDFVTNYREANIQAMRDEIRKTREIAPQGVIGVNIMVAVTNYEDMAKTCMEEGVDLIFSGAGLPLALPGYLRDVGGKTKLVPIVSGSRSAKLIAKRWKDKFNYIPDGFVLEGPLAGGHLGFKLSELEDESITLESLLPSILEAAEEIGKTGGKKIPVIAGGGVFTGGDIQKIMELGADGVQMATRFVTTNECDASDAFKQAYLNAGKEDIALIKSPVGMPGRAIRNPFLDDVSGGKRMPKQCTFHCIHTCKEEESPYCIIKALINACRGNMRFGFAFAGANAWRCSEIISVKELFEKLEMEYSSGFHSANDHF